MEQVSSQLKKSVVKATKAAAIPKVAKAAKAEKVPKAPKVPAAPKQKRVKKTLSFAEIVKRKTPPLKQLLKDKYISDFIRFVKNNELRAEAYAALEKKLQS
jgi:hypothetical protein